MGGFVKTNPTGAGAANAAGNTLPRQPATPAAAAANAQVCRKNGAFKNLKAKLQAGLAHPARNVNAGFAKLGKAFSGPAVKPATTRELRKSLASQDKELCKLEIALIREAGVLLKDEAFSQIRDPDELPRNSPEYWIAKVDFRDKLRTVKALIRDEGDAGFQSKKLQKSLEKIDNKSAAYWSTAKEIKASDPKFYRTMKADLEATKTIEALVKRDVGKAAYVLNRLGDQYPNAQQQAAEAAQKKHLGPLHPAQSPGIACWTMQAVLALSQVNGLKEFAGDDNAKLSEELVTLGNRWIATLESADWNADAGNDESEEEAAESRQNYKLLRARLRQVQQMATHPEPTSETKPHPTPLETVEEEPDPIEEPEPAQPAKNGPG